MEKRGRNDDIYVTLLITPILTQFESENFANPSDKKRKKKIMSLSYQRRILESDAWKHPFRIQIGLVPMETRLLPRLDFHRKHQKKKEKKKAVQCLIAGKLWHFARQKQKTKNQRQVFLGGVVSHRTCTARSIGWSWRLYMTSLWCQEGSAYR